MASLSTFRQEVALDKDSCSPDTINCGDEGYKGGNSAFGQDKEDISSVHLMGDKCTLFSHIENYILQVTLTFLQE